MPASAPPWPPPGLPVYYSDAATCIVHGDCREVLPLLPDASVNVLLVDPPYFRYIDAAFDKQWKTEAAYLDWLRQLCAEWRRLLAPNGSLYCFASPVMAWAVEGVIREQFQVLTHAVWVKSTGNANFKAEKEALRSYLPNTERILFAEHPQSDSMALGTSGYAAQCEQLRGFVFESLRAYLEGERQRAGISFEQVRQIVGCAQGSGLPSHWFTTSQWQLPTADNYAKLQVGFNTHGRFPAPPFTDYHPTGSPFAIAHNGREYLRQDYEYLRQDYETLRQDYERLRQDYERLRQDYESLRRPFTLTAQDQYTDVWTFAPVPSSPGRHPCEKPLALLEHLLRTSSRPGDLVLDCCAGSMSTLDAARRLGRRAIGIEEDAHWCQVGARRLAQEVLPLWTPAKAAAVQQLTLGKKEETHGN